MPRIAERAVTIRLRSFLKPLLVSTALSLAGCQGAPTDTNFILSQRDLPAINAKLRDMRYDEVRDLGDISYTHLSVFFYGTDKYADQLSRLNGGGRPADRRSSLHELYCGLSSAYCSIPIKKLSLEEIGAPREVVVESREADAGVDTPAMELEAMVFENQPDAYVAADVPIDTAPEVRPDIHDAHIKPEAHAPLPDAQDTVPHGRLSGASCGSGFCAFTIEGIDLEEFSETDISVGVSAQGEGGIDIDLNNLQIFGSNQFKLPVEADTGRYRFTIRIGGQLIGSRDISF